MTARRVLGRQMRPTRLVGKDVCIHCDEPSEELDWQDRCPTCVENVRADRGNR